MQLLLPRIDRSFRRNPRQHAFANELVMKIELLRECFLGGILPLPSDEVIAAWNDLPNITMDFLPTSMETRTSFLRALPPTPTEIVFDPDAPMSSDASSNGSHDDDDVWVLVDYTTLSTSDAGVSRAIEDSATGEDDSSSRSSSSDEESLSSSGGSPMPVGFDNMVNQWLLDYRARGMDAFINSLVAFAVISVGTARQASRIVRSVVRKLEDVSYTEGKRLESAVRSAALVAFKKCWESNMQNDVSTEASSTQRHTASPTPYGINIASLMGGLFDQKISTAKDIHLCLSLLLEGEKRLDRLCAMHALLVQANDKMCKNRNLPALMQFKDGITSIGRESGEYLWATGPHSRMVLTEILALIERWKGSQAIKREESQMCSRIDHRTIRNSAVGPRLRNGPVVFWPVV